MSIKNAWRSTLLLWLGNWKVFNECGRDGKGSRLPWVYDSAATIYAKTFIVTLPTAFFLKTDVFGTGIVHRCIVSYSSYHPHTLRVPCPSSLPPSSPESFKRSDLQLSLHTFMAWRGTAFYFRLLLVLLHTWSDNNVRELATVCLPSPHWTKA